MSKRKALIVSQNFEFMLTLPDLLARAGFSVDAIVNNPFLSQKASLDQCHFLKDFNQVAEVALEQQKKHSYALIVMGDDATLGQILSSSLSPQEQEILLPVRNGKNFDLIYSKIGLSIALDQAGVKVPRFRVTQNKADLISDAEVIGYPVLIKINRSCAGVGVFECRNASEVITLAERLEEYPLLVQEKIIGTEFDLSAFFQNGHLIHFNYARVERTCWKFGPSSVRRYFQLADVPKEVFDELSQIGKAMGVHGFVMVTCIQSKADGQRYFFEADLRPSVWVESPKYFGDDPAIPIRKYFETGSTLSFPYPCSQGFPKTLLVPYWFRLKGWEVLLNRYAAWRYLPACNKRLIVYLLFWSLKLFFTRYLRACFPKKYWRLLRAGYQAVRGGFFEYYKNLGV